MKPRLMTPEELERTFAVLEAKGLHLCATDLRAHVAALANPGPVFVTGEIAHLEPRPLKPGLAIVSGFEDTGGWGQGRMAGLEEAATVADAEPDWVVGKRIAREIRAKKGEAPTSPKAAVEPIPPCAYPDGCSNANECASHGTCRDGEVDDRAEVRP